MEIRFSQPITLFHFFFFQLERSSLHQTTFLAFTKRIVITSPFLSQVRHLPLIDWLIFEGEELLLDCLKLT